MRGLVRAGVQTLPALTVIGLLLFLFQFAQPSFALPMYAAEYGSACLICHHNPAGGGIRNLYGSEFISRLDLPSEGVAYPELRDRHLMVDDQLQLGTDFRALYSSSSAEPDAGSDANSFLTMQGDIYLAWFADKTTTLLMELGLRGGFEAALVQRIGNGSLALRAGKLMAGYGWRFADHRAYTRRFTGFGGASGVAGREDGLEVGLYGPLLETSVAVTNGFGQPLLDSDEGKAITARTAARFKLAEGAFRGSVGASYRYAQVGQPQPGTRMGGLFYSLSWRKLSYIGELDAIVASGRSGFVVSNQLRYRMLSGLELRPGYGFYDPDLDLRSGRWARSQLTLAWIPRGYLEIAPTVEFEQRPSGDVTTGILQLHFWL